MPKRKRPPTTKPARPSWGRRSTADIAEALRRLGTVRAVPELTGLVNAAATRLDHYQQMVSLGVALDRGTEITTHEIDLTDIAEERIQAAITAATVALVPHSQEARKAAQAGAYALVDGRYVAKALGAEPAGKALKRARAAAPPPPIRKNAVPRESKETKTR